MKKLIGILLLFFIVTLFPARQVESQSLNFGPVQGCDIVINGICHRGVLKVLTPFFLGSNNSGLFDADNTQYQVPSTKTLKIIGWEGERMGAAMCGFNFYHTTNAIGTNTGSVGTAPIYQLDQTIVAVHGITTSTFLIRSAHFDIPSDRYPNMDSNSAGNCTWTIYGLEQ